MDSKDKAGKQDRDRINVHEQYELRDWAAKFGVTENQVRKAVDEVGPMVKDVEKLITDMKKKPK